MRVKAVCFIFFKFRSFTCAKFFLGRLLIDRSYHIQCVVQSLIWSCTLVSIMNLIAMNVITRTCSLHNEKDNENFVFNHIQMGMPK